MARQDTRAEQFNTLEKLALNPLFLAGAIGGLTNQLENIEQRLKSLEEDCYEENKSNSEVIKAICKRLDKLEDITLYHNWQEQPDGDDFLVKLVATVIKGETGLHGVTWQPTARKIISLISGVLLKEQFIEAHEWLELRK